MIVANSFFSLFIIIYWHGHMVPFAECG
jgi:hypothetical protein